ncbi:MAG: hypothetical protein ACYCQJ_09560 [Nitrososphaerales archaeon]
MASQFAQNEARDILVAWIIVSIALSFGSFLNLLQGINAFTDLEALAASGIAAATAFIIHELGHKFIAQHYSYVAHFQMWRAGLLLLVITAVLSSLVGGFFLFGAPGAVYIAPPLPPVTMATAITLRIRGQPIRKQKICGFPLPGPPSTSLSQRYFSARF